MSSKLAAVFAIALGALSASAMDYSCNSGPVQCCGSLQDSTTYDVTYIASLVGVAVSAVTGQVGLQCNPITVIGSGTGANCASAPVCCEKNFSNQLVGINCTPITVGA
ncbi:fungal hydrophobin-domain-containing protein [Flammula alnicola]|nr:fungal hydrophobin-domain-containing protein [Flammula alnicola]